MAKFVIIHSFHRGLVGINIRHHERPHQFCSIGQLAQFFCPIIQMPGVNIECQHRLVLNRSEALQQQKFPVTMDLILLI
jgi:hypothetical protein